MGETSNVHLGQQTWKVINIFEILEQANPEPKTELEYTNPFTLLVAVILSAQSTDKGVNKATKELFKVADTPKAILAMGEAGLKEHIKTIGLFNSKARNIIAMCEILERDFNGQVPRQMEHLIKLPGVGRKTANVLLNTIWGEPLIAVDTHVFRVARRLRLAEGATPQAVERELSDNIPDRFKRHAHHWLILHGRYICKARTPLCQNCPVSRYCEYFKPQF